MQGAVQVFFTSAMFLQPFPQVILLSYVHQRNDYYIDAYKFFTICCYYYYYLLL